MLPYSKSVPPRRNSDRPWNACTNRFRRMRIIAAAVPRWRLSAKSPDGPRIDFQRFGFWIRTPSDSAEPMESSSTRASLSRLRKTSEALLFWPTGGDLTRSVKDVCSDLQRRKRAEGNSSCMLRLIALFAKQNAVQAVSDWRISPRKLSLRTQATKITPHPCPTANCFSFR